MLKFSWFFLFNKFNSSYWNNRSWSLAPWLWSW